jgi:hypothetical protein
VAEVSWDALLPALRQTSGETFDVLGPLLPGNWWDWQYSRREGDAWPLVAGEYAGRAYVLSDRMGPAMAADRVAFLAAVLGGWVTGRAGGYRTRGEVG